MASNPSVVFTIGSKFDNKGAKEAESSLGKFKALSVDLAGVLATVTGKIKQLSDATITDFKNQNKAVTQLNTALKNNSKLTDNAAKSITKYADSMSRIFGDDAVNDATAYLANMQLTEDQIKATLTAAMDLSSTGMMTLDQATKQLGQTFSGTSGRLGQIIPDLKELTEEELKNGAAIEKIEKAYKGTADAMGNSIEGRESIYNNALGNLKASIGGIFAGISFDSQGKLIEPINKITKKIEELRPKIINFFISLPEIFKLSLETIKSMISQTFSGNGFLNISKFLVNQISTTFENIVVMAGNLLETISSMIIAFIKNLDTGNIGNLLWNVLVKIQNQVGGMLTRAIDIMLEFTNGGGVKGALGVAMGTKKGQLATGIEQNGLQYKSVDLSKSMNATKDIVDNIGKTLINGVNWGTETKNNLQQFFESYTGTTEGLFTQIEEIIGRELPEELKNALAGTVIKTTDDNSDSGNGSGNTIGDKNTTEEDKVIDAITNLFGDLGEVVMLYSTNQSFDATLKLMTDMISATAAKSEAFQKVLNIYTKIMDVMSNLFLPVLEALAKAILFVYDVISTVVYYLTFGHVDLGSSSDLEGEIQSSSSGSSSSSSSSAYSTSGSSAVRDVYVNITYANSYVNGDAEDIAVQLAKEIKAAERRNLI